MEFKKENFKIDKKDWCQFGLTSWIMRSGSLHKKKSRSTILNQSNFEGWNWKKKLKMESKKKKLKK